MADGRGESIEELDARIQERLAETLAAEVLVAIERDLSVTYPENYRADSIDVIRAKNKAALLDASLVTHIEERLRMMEAYTPEERATRRRQWATDICAAIPAIRGKAR